jgi:hypothetical protein
VEAVRRYTDGQIGESPFATAIEGLTILRSNHEKPPAHMISKPAICIVAQGAKWTTFGNKRFEYRAGQAMEVSVEMPSVGRVTEASPSKPFLDVLIEFDLAIMRGVMEELDAPPEARGDIGRGVFVTDFEGPLADCALRLVRLLDTPKGIPTLHPMIMREICYWLLTGPHGGEVAKMTGEQPCATCDQRHPQLARSFLGAGPDRRTGLDCTDEPRARRRDPCCGRYHRRLFLLPRSPRHHPDDGVFCRCRRARGTEGVINMSQISAREDSKSHAARDHWIAKRIFDWSGVPTVHLRPTFFSQWLLYPFARKTIVEQSIINLPYGAGRHAPIAAEDQARLIAALLRTRLRMSVRRTRSTAQPNWTSGASPLPSATCSAERSPTSR